MYNLLKKFIPAEAAEVLVAIKGGVDFKYADICGGILIHFPLGLFLNNNITI